MTPPSRDLPQSGIGTASLLIAVAMLILMIAIIGYAGYMEASTAGGLADDSPIAALIGMGFLGCVVLFVVGLFLGVVGLFQSGRRKLTAILGVVFNGFFILIAIGVIGLGLAVR